jgi:lipoteichoic acid synthase
MKTKYLFDDTRKYIYLTTALLLSFWLISVFEVIVLANSGIKITSITFTLLCKCINDFWAGIVIGLLFFLVYFGFILLKKPVAIIVVKVIFSILLLLQIGLTKYSFATHINLGADVLGYSLKDLYLTVSGSETFSVLYFIPFIIVSLLFLGFNTVLNKFTNRRQISVVVAITILVFGCLKLFIPIDSDAIFQNKLSYLASAITNAQKDKDIADVSTIFYKKEFPLQKSFKKSEDVLAPFFKIKEEKPNIVMIIVEGLGADFVGKNYFHGFTPYLDSMISKSLYWENFISNAGRTFGAAPSLLASLPYGEDGFLELNPLPSHVSLISVLKANDYKTSYYSGDESSFDRKINFLEYNGTDNIIDVNKFGAGYTKTKANSGGFTWGYPDAEIFKKTLADLDSKKQPRLDIIMTLTNHEPFDFPSRNIYLTKVDSILKTNKNLDASEDEITAFKNVFACLLYTDNSIKNFMEAYAKRPEYKNTIFVITGDHRLIPVPQKDKLCRFHVPLYIYSPMLKKPEKFKSISSHWDVTPSLVSFLMNNYKFKPLEKTNWISQGLDTSRQFRNIHNIPLMRAKGSINDYVYKNYYYSEGELFKINENFETDKTNDDAILKTINDSLTEFKRLNAYLTQKNKIISKSLNSYNKPAFEFSASQLLTIKKLTKGLDTDQKFFLARKLAFTGQRANSKLLCNYILNDKPNYGDVRILKGRMLAWERDYKNSEIELLDVVKRTPYYYDSYLALMDMYRWSSQNQKAIKIGKQALKNQIKKPEIGFKLAQTYKRMKNFNTANKVIDSILKIYPTNKEYLTFKKTLK